MTYAEAQIRSHLREAAAQAIGAKCQDLPQFGARMLEAASAALGRAFLLADAIEISDDLDADFATATARIAEAAAALAASCAVE